MDYPSKTPLRKTECAKPIMGWRSITIPYQERQLSRKDRDKRHPKSILRAKNPPIVARRRNQSHKHITQHHSSILLIAIPILNSKQNLHPQATPPTPNNNLPMIRLPLQVLLRNQKPPLIATPTPSIPERSVCITLIARKILQINNLQARMENRSCLLPLRDPCAIESQRPIVFSA